MTPHPRLRPDVVIRRLKTREESYVIAKDPVERKYFKFEDWEHDLLPLVDGSRDLDSLCRDFTARHPEIGVDPTWMADYIETLRGMGLIERSAEEQNLMLVEKMKKMRRRRRYVAETSTLFQVQVPLFDPDHLMDRMLPWMRWLWSPVFVALWGGVFAIVLGFLIYHWDLYWAGFFDLWRFPERGIAGWLGFFGLLFVVSVWHELGHGFTCKRFGGEVHDIGFMFFYLQPAFYCSIDDSYLFPKQSHRLYATFGGPYFELMMCSAALALWLVTPAEWWVHSLAMAVVFITGLSVIVLNVNPLIKLDGYYVLMDMLDVPNLREESFEYIGNLLKRHLLHLSAPARPISRRRRRIFLVYGLSSVLYTITVLAVVYLFVRHLILGWFGPTGYVVLFAMIGFAFRKKLRAGGGFLRHLWLDKRELLASPRGRWTSLVLLALVALLLFLPVFTLRLEAPFVVEPGARGWVAAPSAGLVASVQVKEGSAVRTGQVVGVLSCPEIVAENRRAGSDFDRARLEAAGARDAADLVAAAEWSRREQEAAQRGGLMSERARRLVMTAPMDGVVSTHDAEDLEGTYLEEGQRFVAVDRLDTVRLAVASLESQLEEIREGEPVRFRATAYPGRRFSARVLSVAPVAEAPTEGSRSPLDLALREQRVRILVEVPNPSGLLKPGMTGEAQLLAPRRSLAGKLWWSLRRWFGRIVW